MSKRVIPAEMAVLLTNKRQKLQNKEKKATKNVIKTHASTALPQSKVDTDVVRSKAHTVDDTSEWCDICEKKVPINMMQVHIAGRRHRKRERNCDAAARVGSKRASSANRAFIVAWYPGTKHVPERLPYRMSITLVFVVIRNTCVCRHT